MEEIGMFDAKTRFSEIAKRVKETGQPIRITNRGEEMVDIVPVESRAENRRSKSQALATLSKLRRTLPKSSIKQINADIAEGRR